MDTRSYVNSESHAKLLREKTKRETKVAKVQSKILQQSSTKLPVSQKKPKKLSEKWLKPPHSPRPDENSKVVSDSENDLLSEINSSLKGDAKGFVLKTGN